MPTRPQATFQRSPLGRRGASPICAPTCRTGRRRRGFSRLLHGGPLLGLVTLALAGVLAYGASPLGPGAATGSFRAGPHPGVPGTAGGSELNVSSDGYIAYLRLWVPVGVPTYFLDVVEFEVLASRQAEVSVGVSLTSSVTSLPPNAEVYGIVGTPGPHGHRGGSISSAPEVRGGTLQALEGLGGKEGANPGLETGLDIGPTGTTGIGSEPGTSLSLAAGANYVLVLSVGVLLPASNPSALSGTAFTITITLSSAL